MRRTNRSLIYVAAYLLGVGIFLVLDPRLALKLLLSTGEYGEILPRLAGLLFLGIGIIVVQIIRLQVTFLYPTTLAVRAVFFVGFVCLYIMSRDPLFLVLLAVLGVGMLASSISYVLDKRDSAH
jgi:hypothetical protein